MAKEINGLQEYAGREVEREREREREKKLAIGTWIFFASSVAHLINMMGARYFKDVSHQLHVNVFSYECLGCNFLSQVHRIYTYPSLSKLIYIPRVTIS